VTIRFSALGGTAPSRVRSMAQHMICTQGVPGSIPEGYNLSLRLYLHSDTYTNNSSFSQTVVRNE
jgi:hypothetical protein